MPTFDERAEVDPIAHAVEPDRYRQDGEGETTFMSVVSSLGDNFDAQLCIIGRLIPRMSLISQILRELHQNSQHQRQRLGPAPVLIDAESEVLRLVQEAEQRAETGEVQEAVV